MKNLLLLLSFVALFVLLYFIGNIGIEKTEKMECRKWVKESQELQGFYWTPWQKAQCEHYGIIK